MNDTIQPKLAQVPAAVVKNNAAQQKTPEVTPSIRVFSEVVKRISWDVGGNSDRSDDLASTGTMDSAGDTDMSEMVRQEGSETISVSVTGFEFDDGALVPAAIATVASNETTVDTGANARLEPSDSPLSELSARQSIPYDLVEGCSTKFAYQVANDLSDPVALTAASQVGSGQPFDRAISSHAPTAQVSKSDMVPTHPSTVHGAASGSSQSVVDLHSEPVPFNEYAGHQLRDTLKGGSVNNASSLPADRAADVNTGALTGAVPVSVRTFHAKSESGEMASANSVDRRLQPVQEISGRQHPHGDAQVCDSSKAAQTGDPKAVSNLPTGKVSTSTAAPPHGTERQGSTTFANVPKGPSSPVHGMDKATLSRLSISPSIPLTATESNEDGLRRLPSDLGMARAADVQVVSGSAVPPPTSLDRPTLVQIVQASPQPGQSMVEITLSPEELGRVRMSLSNTEGALIVTLSAERPETMDLLRRHASELAAQYRALGYDTVDFQFQQNSQHSGYSERQDAKYAIGLATQAEVSNAQAFTMTVSQTGVDIRI